jgi:GAF domain-containing protein
MSEAAPENSERKLAEALRRLVLSIEATGRAILPRSNEELLQTIVEAAARLFGAAASSIALIDEQAQMLEFRVATGAGSDEVIGMRIPVSQGIAGYVAMTGQPMAVSSVQQDPRFARETAEKTGYVPRSILAMPLMYNERVIGVIEVLDKIDAPSFGMQDMELLGIFARQAAVAIHASEQYRRLGDALVRGIRDLTEAESGAGAEAVSDALGDFGAEEEPNDLFALADVFAAFSDLGAAERQACLKILSAFSDYVGSRPDYAI